jgi:microcystin-dependent protein
MSVTNTNNKMVYVCNGSQTVFPFTYRVSLATEMVVSLYNIATGLPTPLTYGTHYTISGLGLDAGGSVTTLTAYATGYKIILLRVIPNTQPTVYVENDPLPAATIMADLDRAAMRDQQLQEQMDRCFKISLGGESISPDEYVAALQEASTAAVAAAEAAVPAAATATSAATAADTARVLAEAAKVAAEAAAGSGTPTGTVMPWLTNTAPTAFLICDGTAISRATYSDLFAIIGTTYGAGDGSTTFNLPNMKGRVLVGRDAGQTEFDVIGETGGEKTHTLTLPETPSHGHTYIGQSASDSGAGGSGNGWYHFESGKTTGSAGGDGAHNNLQPYIVVNYIVKYTNVAMLTAKATTPQAQAGVDDTAYMTPAKVASAITALAGGGAWTDYGGSTTIVGLSVVSYKTVFYVKLGKLCFVMFNINGASNATGFSFTLPYANNSSKVVYAPLGYTYDNGSFPSANGLLWVNNGSNVCSLGKDLTSGLWTASGNKNVYGQFFYEVA